MEEAHDLIGEHSTADEPERIELQEHAASLAGDAALASVAASSLHEALQQGLLPRGAVAAAVRAALPTRSAATARDDAALTAGLSLLDLLMSSGEESLLLQRDGDAVVAAQLETLWGNFEQRFRPAEMAGLPTRTVLARAVGFMRAIMSDNQSLIRISFRRSLADEAAWMPIRGFGRTFEARLFDLLATRSQDFAVADWRQAYAVGMQIVYGTMLTAILRRPGPMMIEDEQMAEVLTDMLVRQLRLR